MIRKKTRNRLAKWKGRGGYLVIEFRRVNGDCLFPDSQATAVYFRFDINTIPCLYSLNKKFPEDRHTYPSNFSLNFRQHFLNPNVDWKYSCLFIKSLSK
ncbi:hypothetical protein Csa_000210 [Cucumis sativus]|uniref:Uncharacterized protein n=1 Tax=Cucumis sativus TaxID=3659 RepID=A0A0A0KLS5_CUCSA|nr:hypothetical protein Csa_000210 [Cucumis sativus]